MKRLDDLRIALASIALALSGFAAPASAIVAPSPTYDDFLFSGICSNDEPDCPDGSAASAWLKVSPGYTLGTTLTTTNVLGFEYSSPSSTVITTDLIAEHIGYVSGAIATIPGSNDFQIGFNTNLAQCTPGSETIATCDAQYRFQFTSGSDGTWAIAPFADLQPNDAGNNGLWTVPEPGALALLGIGLAGLVAARRRNAR